MTEPTRASSAQLERAIAATLALPIAKACDLQVTELEPGRAIARLRVTEAVSLGSHQLNGGELYGLLDYVAFLAIAPMLPDEEAAVTHDAHFSILRPAPRGSEVELRATVEKRGRSVAFSRVEAWRIEDDGDALVATATITKSIVSLAFRKRHVEGR